MSGASLSPRGPAAFGAEGPITAPDYARVIWKYRWFILGLCLVAVLTTGILTLQSSKIYQAKATLLVPKEGGSGGLLGTLATSGLLLQQLPGLSVPSLTPNRDIVISILKSRSLGKAVVAKFQLQDRYNAQYSEDAISKLEDKRDILVSKEGVISVTFEDTDPRMAADITNFHLEELDRLLARFSTGEAGRQRGFIAEQLARAKANLDISEHELRRFQERNRAIVLQEQTRGAIEAAARLKGEIIASEIQLQVLRSFATDSNPEVIRLRRRVEEMKRQLDQMQYGDNTARREASGQGVGQREFYVPFARVPEVGLELARLTREVKVQETLVLLLIQQLEQARIAEAKDYPTVHVLDSATPPNRPFKPRLRVNLTISAVLALFAAVLFAFTLEYFSRGRFASGVSASPQS